MVLSGTDGSRKLSESMNDLRQEEWEGTETPPGTPPPPYPSPQVSRRDRICIPEDEDAVYGDVSLYCFLLVDYEKSVFN